MMNLSLLSDPWPCCRSGLKSVFWYSFTFYCISKLCTKSEPASIWTHQSENPAAFVFKQISTNCLRDQVRVGERREGVGGDGGCKGAITQNTFGGHYGASHAEWLLQAETLLIVFKVDLMKAFIQSSSLVWALDSTHSQINHCGPVPGGQCREFCFSFISA